MHAITKFGLTVLVVAGGVFLVRNGADALHPALPPDMPSSAHFVQSGYDIRHNEPQGEWVACRTDSAQNADFCRVTDAHGTVIYQGDFLTVKDSQPVPQNQLKVASVNDKNLWIEGPAEASPVPVIPLRNGSLLVPAADTYALADRWNANPEELRRIEGQ